MNNTKIGILGGGQLGRMLLLSAVNYPVETYVLDPQEDAPAKYLCNHFTQGSLLDKDTVIEFGKDLDIITIEIENVNLPAMFQLKEMGKRVIPDPDVLSIIQDKALQNEFYVDHEIPTPPFKQISSKKDLERYVDNLPLVQKLRRYGYDGKGVQVLDTAKDMEIAFDEPSIVEEKVNIEKEIGIIAIKSTSGEISMYPPTEMAFNQKFNLVDFILSPADLPKEIILEIELIAKRTVEAFQWPGIYAIEMFLSKNGAVYVNETAPRVHNSGHSTIEGNYTSQFDQQIRVLLGMSPGSTETTKSSLMYNIIGPPGIQGKPVFEGLEAITKLDYVYLHLYGKSVTRPGRKLGHITILGNSRNELIEKLNFIKSAIRITV